MLDQLKGIHIELTNMCTLKCPRCARTKFEEQFPGKWKNKNLNFEDLKKFLDVDLTGKVIRLCGNDGDPIYHSEFIEIIKWIKQQGATLDIVTNGSYRTEEWWNKLIALLTTKDKLTFSIDGVPENFTQYRVNADWESIKTGINVASQGTVTMIWKYILFSFNENSVDDARKMSQELGFDHFELEISDRYDSDSDWLIPVENYNKVNFFKEDWKKSDRNKEIDPRCKKRNDQHYISSSGYYMPCCLMSDYRFYYKSDFYVNKETYDISNTTLSQILQSETIINFYNTLEDAKLSYCTFNCPKL